MAIYYKYEIVDDLLKIRKRADTVTYLLYDNGHKINIDDAHEIRAILSNAVEQIDAIKAKRRNDKELLKDE
jgi:hypothetical protein